MLEQAECLQMDCNPSDLISAPLLGVDQSQDVTLSPANGTAWLNCVCQGYNPVSNVGDASKMGNCAKQSCTDNLEDCSLGCRKFCSLPLSKRNVPIQEDNQLFASCSGLDKP
jgi:hypothetical protein